VLSAGPFEWGEQSVRLFRQHDEELLAKQHKIHELGQLIAARQGAEELERLSGRTQRLKIDGAGVRRSAALHGRPMVRHCLAHDIVKLLKTLVFENDISAPKLLFWPNVCLSRGVSYGRRRSRQVGKTTLVQQVVEARHADPIRQRR
jgi:hypothetical protein